MAKDKRGIPDYPHPYKVIDGCLFIEVRIKNGSYDQKLCNFLPYILSEITLDDGAEETKRLRLGGIRQNGTALPEIEIGSSELGSFNWLIDQWGADCILEVGPVVKDKVRYAIQQTAHTAQRQTVYAVTGWKQIDGIWHFLMPGDQELTVQLPDKLSRYDSATKHDPKALSVLDRLLNHPPAPKEVIWPLLAYTFLSPLNHFLHRVDCEPKFVFLLLGRTGAGKSTLAALFLSFFGRFTASDLPLSFRDTPNSIIHNTFALKDVLTCIDDFHPCGRQEEQKLTASAQSIIRAYGDRVGRGRLRADASFMSARQPQGNAIITAEYPPDVGESGTARCLAVELRLGDMNLNELSFFQSEAAAGTLQSCMPVWRALGLPEGASQTQVNKAFRKVVTAYKEEYNKRLARDGRPDADIPIFPFLCTYLEKAKSRLQLSTYQGYHQMVYSRIQTYFNARPRLTVESITPKDIEAFDKWLFGEGLKTGSVIHYHTLLHSAFQQAYKEELLDANPFDRVERPKKSDFHGDHYSEDELVALFELSRSDPIWPCIVLAGGMGLRRSEVLGVRWSRIDMDKRTVLLDTKIVEEQSDGKPVLRAIEEMKNKSSRRTLPIPDPVYEMLETVKARQEINRKLFRGIYNRTWDDYVCTDELGDLMRPNFVTDHFSYLLGKLGLRHIRFHDLRHTFASVLLGKEVPLINVSNFLGHSTISTTANIYAHLDKAAKQSSADVISDIFRKEEAGAAE